MQTNPQQQSGQAVMTIAQPDFDMHRVEQALRTNHKLFGGTPLSEAEITRSLMEYSMFLQRHKVAGMPDDFEKPSAEIDRVWHTHMCETLQYQQDCHAYFGKMFHHSNATCDMKPSPVS